MCVVSIKVPIRKSLETYLIIIVRLYLCFCSQVILFPFKNMSVSYWKIIFYDIDQINTLNFCYYFICFMKERMYYMLAFWNKVFIVFALKKCFRVGVISETDYIFPVEELLSVKKKSCDSFLNRSSIWDSEPFIL